MLNVLFFVCKV